MTIFDDSREVAIVLIYVCVPVSTLAVALRSYSRISILCNIISSILGIVVLETGAGKPVAALSLEEFEGILKIMWGMFPFCQAYICFIQLGYLAFYRRFLVDRTFQVLHFVAGFVVLQNVFFTFLVLFRCNPVAHVWNPLKFREGCLNWPKIVLAHAVVNIACDIAIYSLPLPSVLRLRVKWRRKLSLLSLFLLGFIVLTASAWRLYTVIKFYLGGPEGSSFSSINAATIEYNLAILIACIPGMKPLFMKAFNIQSNPGTFRMSLNTINDIAIYGPPEQLQSDITGQRQHHDHQSHLGSTTSTMYTYSAHVAAGSDVAIINRGHEVQGSSGGGGGGGDRGRDLESGVLEGESENGSAQEQNHIHQEDQQSQGQDQDLERQSK